MHMHTHVHTHIHAHTYMCAHAHTRACTQIHTCTHINTQHTHGGYGKTLVNASKAVLEEERILVFCGTGG